MAKGRLISTNFWMDGKVEDDFTPEDKYAYLWCLTNAYLAMLYWDSEMFHRTTRKRRELEGKDTKDYRALLKEMLFERPADFFNTPHKREVAKQYRKLFIRMDGMARPRDYRKMYEGLVAGDPKLRTLRAIYQDISCAYAAYAKSFRKGGEANG